MQKLDPDINYPVELTALMVIVVVVMISNHNYPSSSSYYYGYSDGYDYNLMMMIMIDYDDYYSKFQVIEYFLISNFVSGYDLAIFEAK